MKHSILLLLVTVFSFSCAKYCKISNGNLLHLICQPEDTEPIHVIKDASVGCENETEVALRENIKTIQIATCSFDDFNLFKNFTELKFSFFHEIKSLRKEAFVGMDHVKRISIGYSNAEVLDSAFSDLPKLRQVDIYDNKLKLSDLAFKGANQLKLVTLSDWLRSSLPAGFFRDLNNLEYLSLGRHFENLSDINFTGLEKIKLLHLNMNQIQNLTGHSLHILKNLRYSYLDMDIYDNKLKLSDLAFKGANQLKLVTLSDWLRSSLPAGFFRDLNNLEYLSLGRHFENLSDINFTGLEKIKLLHLNMNQIQNLTGHSLHILKNLRYSYLDYNRLTDIGAMNFSKLENLIFLNLEGNHIHELYDGAFSGLSNLRCLLLYSNHISHIETGAFSSMENLKKLDLTNNRLTSLDWNTFKGLVSLQYLSLRENSISTIGVNTFASLPKLIQLDLSRQVGWFIPGLETIDLNAFPQFIDLRTKSVTRTRINGESNDFENTELQTIKDIFSFENDGDLRFYKTKYFDSFELNKNDYPQTDLNNLTNGLQNVSMDSLIFGNLDLSSNPITSINLLKN